MSDLSKQQLILLALLVSFVTSLATGIVTVSLMQQVPGGVTQTITQVIEKTIADVPPDSASSTAAVSIAVNDQVADATAFVTPSLVRLRDGNTGAVGGLGLIVSPTGVIMTDKNMIDRLNAPQAVLPDGAIVSLTVIRFQIQGDIVFMQPSQPITESLTPISFADPARLGATFWSLTGTSTYILSQGIVSELDPIPSSSFSVIHTTIPIAGILPGAPLFDATGAVVGIETQSLSGTPTAAFYPIQAVRDGVPN